MYEIAVPQDCSDIRERISAMVGRLSRHGISDYERDQLEQILERTVRLTEVNVAKKYSILLGGQDLVEGLMQFLGFPKQKGGASC